MNELAVREITEQDIDPLLSYWLDATPDFLISLGVDINKIPQKEEFREMLRAQLSQSYEEKKAYAIIWLIDNNAVGHSNVNKIVFGQEAYMHLHLWKSEVRKKGMGTDLVKMTLPYFFENLKLEALYCEPYALNPAPNNTLKKVGFDFVYNYITTPGWINFEQPVNRWQMSYEKFKTFYG